MLSSPPNRQACFDDDGKPERREYKNYGHPEREGRRSRKRFGGGMSGALFFLSHDHQLVRSLLPSFPPTSLRTVHRFILTFFGCTTAISSESDCQDLTPSGGHLPSDRVSEGL